MPRRTGWVLGAALVAWPLTASALDGKAILTKNRARVQIAFAGHPDDTRRARTAFETLGVLLEKGEVSDPELAELEQTGNAAATDGTISRREGLQILEMAERIVSIATRSAAPTSTPVSPSGPLPDECPVRCPDGMHFKRTPTYAQCTAPSGALEGARARIAGGRLLACVEYRGGKLRGRHREWWPNGNPRLEGEHGERGKQGTWTRWYEDGTRAVVLDWKDGHKAGHARAWWPNGKLRAEGDYENGKKTGEWTLWYESGVKAAVTEFWDGRKEGREVTWWPSGQKQANGRWINVADDRRRRAVKRTLRDGIWQAWHDNGQGWFQCTYRSGKTVGPCVELDENGKRMTSVAPPVPGVMHGHYDLLPDFGYDRLGIDDWLND